MEKTATKNKKATLDETLEGAEEVTLSLWKVRDRSRVFKAIEFNEAPLREQELIEKIISLGILGNGKLSGTHFSVEIVMREFDFCGLSRKTISSYLNRSRKRGLINWVNLREGFYATRVFHIPISVIRASKTGPTLFYLENN